MCFLIWDDHHSEIGKVSVHAQREIVSAFIDIQDNMQIVLCAIHVAIQRIDTLTNKDAVVTVGGDNDTDSKPCGRGA